MAGCVSRMAGPFGAVVEGIDLARDADDTTLRTLITLLHDFGILVIRRQSLRDANHVRFGRGWGMPLGFFFKDHPRDDFARMIRICNDNAPPLAGRDGAVDWHSDGGYEEGPASVTMLLGTEALDRGGETLFASTALAYAALPHAMKGRIAGRTALYRRGGAPWVGGEVIPLAGRPQIDPPVVRHPIVMVHPVTGRASLFVSGTVFAIEGMDATEARALIGELRRHMMQVRFRQSYKIEVGDLVLWDNFSTVHTATKIVYSDEDGERRVLYRIGTKGLPALSRQARPAA